MHCPNTGEEICPDCFDVMQWLGRSSRGALYCPTCKKIYCPACWQRNQYSKMRLFGVEPGGYKYCCDADRAESSCFWKALGVNRLMPDTNL